ncbi:hypothetical protein HMPREF1544_04765 [Mucor circinelloides 1006PhL]|uniref:Uncharacterized protein n=1 Tax=Mucor circinelloides f. circinelloides (strain 1006PhL) TaxID=1220926 RepID=S2JEY8_MUCC1|nr:hypothetical protein HMPREF1544_04765 [Mucor circinelloides 1006PhL]
MVDNHYQRSLVNKVFVSSCSNASSPFSERDLSDQYELLCNFVSNQLISLDMLDYVANSGNICIVSFDFAGLSTNVSDL